MAFLAKILVVVAVFAIAPAFAAEQPSARVGRVSFISGTLAFYGPEDTDWSVGEVNYPAKRSCRTGTSRGEHYLPTQPSKGRCAIPARQSRVASC